MVWTYIHLEGSCMFGFLSKKSAEHHIPKSERPVWCKNKNKKRIPQFRCFSNGKKEKRCPFFGYCNADKRNYLLFDKVFETP